MFKRNVRYFEYCYENDTAIEYVETGLYSSLNCSYTCEDPDYGTDTVHFTVDGVKNEKYVAYKMLQEVTKYLDYVDHNIKDMPRELRVAYGEYSLSTMIAIEKALQEITDGYKPNRQFVTIEEAGKIIGEEFLHGTHRTFHFCESDMMESEEQNPDTYEGSGWYGIKRIEGFFDNSPRDLIIAVGYWGGGNCAFGYVNEEDTDTTLVQEEIWKAMCESTGGNVNDIIFLEMDEKENA